MKRLCIFTAVNLSSVATSEGDTMPEKKPFERLPKDVVPTNYNIRLKPNLKTFTFDGYEQIDIQVNNLLCVYMCVFILFI